MRAIVQKSIIDKVTRLNEALVLASSLTLAVTAACLVLGVVISLLITRSITVPLEQMAKKTAEIGSGVDHRRNAEAAEVNGQNPVTPFSASLRLSGENS